MKHVSLYTGMGINYGITPDFNDYLIAAIPYSTSDSIKSFNAGVEFFGGPLLAFAPARPVDPLQTRLSGGSTRNAFGQEPGTTLGTELDLGTRVRFMFFGSELVGGMEAAVLFPGDAFITQTGLLDPIYGARATLTARL